MLKSLVYNGIEFVYDLPTSLLTLSTISRLFIIFNIITGCRKSCISHYPAKSNREKTLYRFATFTSSPNALNLRLTH